MNCRTMVKGALALSLSLIVGSSWAAQTTPSDDPKYGATFESAPSAVAPLNDFAYTEGDGITNAAYRLPANEPTYGWFAGSDDDESKIITRDLGENQTGQALQLNTDAATLTNLFNATTKTAVNDTLENEGTIFFETEVKFVASDTDSAGIKGGEDATKFAIYAYSNEDKVGENENATTNLVVFHAYRDFTDESLAENNYYGYTNEIFATPINTEVYTKLRIEMKQTTIGGTSRNLFSVKVGNDPVLTSPTAYEGGIWFLTVEDVGDDDNKEVSSLNFKGTGEIDNISVGTIVETTTYAIDWTDSDGVAVASAGSALGEGDTNFLAGAEIVFTATGEGVTITNIMVDGVAQSITNETVYSYFVGEADAIVTVLAGEEPAATTGTVIFLAEDGTTQLNSQELAIDAVPVYAGQASGTNGTATAAGITTFTGWTNETDNAFYAVGTDLPAVTAGTTYYKATFSTVAAVASVNGAFYATLAAAVEAATGTANPVVLNGNVALDDWILVDGAVTIDLAGYTISKGDNWSTATPAHDALIAVLHGGSLTLNDSSDPSTGVVDGSALVCGIKMTISGDTNDTNPATLVVNGGTVKGKNFGISGNGLAGRGNTAITINGGTILGTDATSDSCGIFHPQAGTLTINGGHIEGGQGIWMKSGTCTCTVNAGEIVGNGPQGTYVSSGNGSGKTGDAFVVDNVGYPGGAPAPAILGGTFVSSNANAVASYSNAANEPIDSFVEGGTCNTPVPADLCADGYEPDSWEEGGVTYYGVKPASPATVITVACVNGATYTEADGVYTFAPPSADYTVSSVFTNGVNANTTTTLDLSAAEGDIKVVVAATKTRTAPEHKWYENPGKVYKYQNPYSCTDSVTGYNWVIEKGNDYMLDLAGWSYDGAALYDFSAIEALAGTEGVLSPIWKYKPTGLRGGTVSKEYNVALFGTTSSSASVKAAPLSADAAGADGIVTNITSVTFKNMSGNAIANPTMLAFSAGSRYLFANSGDGSVVYKFALAGVDFTSDVELTAVAEYDIGKRVRNFACGMIDNAEVLLVINDTKTVKKVDIATGAVTDTTIIQGSNYDNICIAGSSVYLGLATGGGDNATVNAKVILKRFSIGANATFTEEQSWTKAQFLALTGATANGSNPVAFTVSDDEKSLLIAFQASPANTRYLIQYVEPVYDVTVTVEGGTISTGIDAVPTGTTLHVAAGTEIVFTATTGNTLSSVTTNTIAVAGIDTTAATYTYTVGDSGATVAVVFAEPPAGYNYPEGGAIEDADVVAWLTTKGFTQAQVTALGTNAKLNECYLLNCDISQAGAGGSITISAITVTGSSVTVTVELDRTAGIAGGINGTLKLQGTADLATAPATLTEGVSVVNEKFTTDGPATATFTGSGAKFFKAVIE